MRDFPDFSLDELSSMNQNITAGLAQLDMEPEPAPPDEKFFLDGTFQCSSSSYAQLGCCK